MNTFKRNAYMLIAAMLFPAMAQSVVLSDTPLFLTAPVEPNIVMTLDNSGSMAWAYVPDSLAIASGTKRLASSDYNALYYNPLVTYGIPTRKDGVSYTTSFTTAYFNGFDTSKGNENLSNAYYVTTTFYNDTAGDWTRYDAPGIGVSRAAYYFRYLPGSAGCNTVATKIKTNDSCYTLVRVGTGSDITAGTSAQQQQNFANWFSFYRTRSLSLISASMAAAGQIGDGEARLAWQSISCNSFTCCDNFSSATYCKGYTSTTYDNRIRDLTPAHRTDFYNWLQRFSSDSGTPLRSAMIRAGQYFKTSGGLNNPYAENPQVTLGTELACRKNFHIMVTDGEWNTDSDASVTTAIGTANQDNTAKTLPDGTGYTPMSPYKDANSDSLADIAFYYWSTDLRSDLADKVPPYNPDTSGTASAQYWNAKNDPANWQHMLNFTMGIGLGGSLTNHPIWGGSTYAGEYSSIVDGTYGWPATFADADPGNVYDLWHAAIDSRGQFFSVDNPSSMTTAFRTILNAINATVSAAAGLSTNSTSIKTDSLLFQARFNPKDWSGQLLAYPILSDGSLAATPSWDAGLKVSASRSPSKVFTWNPTSSAGVVFKWTNLSGGQQTLLNKNISGTADGNGSIRLNWLMGDTTKEVRFGGIFRNRVTTVLGDIINSDLAYTHNEDYGYGAASFGGSSTEKAAYSSFLTAKSSRPAMVYAGANDGMMHGFEADLGASGGNELLAFVPNSVYANLSALTDPGYAHKYFVDSPAGLGDAYFSGAWHTVLVSGLGKGGQAVFGLDISNPASFSAGNVLWEKSSSNAGFADLGYVYGKPKIAKLNSGQWVAIFSNGYNSATGAASLFVVDIATGAKVAEIVADDGTSGANGLSDPVLIDVNGDRIVDFVYAGDLKGNMWKFNLTTLTVSYKLYQATSAGGVAQPITEAPTWGASPDTAAGGDMVYFGTGEYLGLIDVSDSSVQTFYGIWDKGAAVTGRSQLQEQDFVAAGTSSGKSLRETTNNSVDWSSGKRGWYLDLGYTAPGERVVKKPVLALGWLLFTTVVPKNDRCDAGGDSWLVVLDPTTGKRPGILAIDVDGDRSFTTAKDAMPDGIPPSSMKSDIGILSAPLVVSYSSGSSGSSYDAYTESIGGSGDATGGGATGGSSYASGSGGAISVTPVQANSPPPAPPTPSVNRIYWFQIQ